MPHYSTQIHLLKRRRWPKGEKENKGAIQEDQIQQITQLNLELVKTIELIHQFS
jgi:hypothetical protein